MKKGRELQKAFFKGWVVFAVLGMVLPILLFCLIFGTIFFGFWLPMWNDTKKKDEQFQQEFKKF